MTKKYQIFFLAGLLVLLTACSSGKLLPVNNVTNAPVVANRAVTQDDVKTAIIRAGAKLGWQMLVTKPGLITATLVLRTHTAIVEIPYDAKSYSIKYKDSTNLKYDGNGIHPYYNNWIINLDQGIRVQLASV